MGEGVFGGGLRGCLVWGGVMCGREEGEFGGGLRGSLV